MSQQGLAGKVAIVTGAGSGIGQSIAVRLASHGARVVVDYIGADTGAKETLQQIEQAGGTGAIFRADIARLPEINQLIDFPWQTYGSADILINNAGVEKASDFVDVTEEEYDFILDINLKGAFFTTQAFGRRLFAAHQPGRVINISSVHEDMVFPHFATYCAAKGGLRMLMRDLAVELGPRNITVNNIAPGAIVTPINKALLEDKTKLDAVLANIPLGRLGSVEDVANLAAFLAGDEASYITGSTFVVDGGLMRSYHEQ